MVWINQNFKKKPVGFTNPAGLVLIQYIKRRKRDIYCSTMTFMFILSPLLITLFNIIYPNFPCSVLK